MFLAADQIRNFDDVITCIAFFFHEYSMKHQRCINHIVHLTFIFNALMKTNTLIVDSIYYLQKPFIAPLHLENQDDL